MQADSLAFHGLDTEAVLILIGKMRRSGRKGELVVSGAVDKGYS